MLADAAARVGHPAVRNRGTVGGNLAFADPANNLPVVAVALDAEIACARRAASERYAAADFFRGSQDSALEPANCCAARFPGLPGGAGSAFDEVSRAAATGPSPERAAVLGRGRPLAGARLALIGAARRRQMHAAEAALGGAEPGDEVFAAADAAAHDAVTDARGTSASTSAAAGW